MRNPKRSHRDSWRPGVWAAALLSGLLACSNGPLADDGDPRRLGGDGGAAPTASDGGGPTGLPCDVAALLRDRCASCHRAPPVGGAPMALLSHEDLSRPSMAAPGQSVAQRSLARMTDGARPMPPGAAPSVPAVELQAFRAWVQAGLPRGGCGDGAADLGPDPFSAPPVCTSMRYWPPDDDDDDNVRPLPEAGRGTDKKDGSPEMNPGRPCIACHRAERDGPRLFVGGTVYPTAHEPDLCLGAPAAVVEITDAAGAVRRLPTNGSGNFLLRDDGTLRPPIRARVLYEGRERRMAGAQMSGDCNACHTQGGAGGAPGRILLP